jgi:hypothetical protein
VRPSDPWRLGAGAPTGGGSTGRRAGVRTGTRTWPGGATAPPARYSTGGLGAGPGQGVVASTPSVRGMVPRQRVRGIAAAAARPRRAGVAPHDGTGEALRRPDASAIPAIQRGRDLGPPTQRRGHHQPGLVRQRRSRIVRRGDGAEERRYCFRFVIGYSLSVAQERVRPGDAGVLPLVAVCKR